MIQFTDTTVIDNYTSDTVFAATAQYRAAEVTRVTVEITPAEEDPESLYVDVRIGGYELTIKGARDQRKGYGIIYGARDVQDRYNLVREALLATVARHGIDGSRIDDLHFTMTWDQYKARETALFAARLHR